MSRFVVEFRVPIDPPIEVAERLIGFKRSALPFEVDAPYDVYYPLRATVEAESREDAVKRVLREFGFVDDVEVEGTMSDYEVFALLDEVEKANA